jgi:hypothetical protein
MFVVLIIETRSTFFSRNADDLEVNLVYSNGFADDVFGPFPKKIVSCGRSQNRYLGKASHVLFGYERPGFDLNIAHLRIRGGHADDRSIGVCSLCRNLVAAGEFWGDGPSKRDFFLDCVGIDLLECLH